MELAAAVNRLPGSTAQATVVQGADDERTGLFIDGKPTTHLLQLKPELRAAYPHEPNGKVRLNVGELGKRKSFRQRSDGGYDYDRAAALLAVLVNPGKQYVVLQLVGNDDYYRLIAHDTLREIARLGMVARKRLWDQSKPAEISSTNQVDYVLVTDDKESWDDLRQTFKEEDDENSEDRQT
jgi:hypothetical protein